MHEDSYDLNEPWNWQDWVDMLLGIWLAASPWILDFADGDPAAARDALLVGVLIAVLSALTFVAYHVVEEWVDLALGVWLVLSPWILPVSGNPVVTADFTLVGAAVLALSAWEIWDGEHGRPHPV